MYSFRALQLKLLNFKHKATGSDWTVTGGGSIILLRVDRHLPRNICTMLIPLLTVEGTGVITPALRMHHTDGRDGNTGWSQIRRLGFSKELHVVERRSRREASENSSLCNYYYFFFFSFLFLFTNQHSSGLIRTPYGETFIYNTHKQSLFPRTQTHQ